MVGFAASRQGGGGGGGGGAGFPRPTRIFYPGSRSRKG